ncbi:MAG: TadE/TadG family type IV pilus assembly protein [Pseudomonadota bacterium]
MGKARHPQAGQRFVSCRRGSSAVEFALIAPLFLALTFSVIESGYFFFIDSAVNAANAKAARLIRTGQAQTGAISRDAFFDEICDVVQLFGDCAERLTVDVARFSTFAELAADVAAPVCRDADPDAVDAIPYETGAARDIVRVRVCYLHKSFNPGFGLNLERAKGGAVKIFSTTIFRNEPYES